MINHCVKLRRITLLSDTDISFGLFNLFTKCTYFDVFWVIVINTLKVKEIFKVYLITKDIS